MHDYLATNLLIDPGGRGCVIGAPLRRVQRARRGVRHTWDRLAAHICAGLRLRARLGDAGPLDGVEAIVTPEGAVEDAADAAKPRSMRERLRDAARRIERARGRLRRTDPGASLELWQGLVSGRWSLVDHYERGGRRYLIARRNDPDVADPRALSLRERQVAWYASLGHTNKLIAYELGLTASTVATHLSRAMAKLHVPTRAALIALVRGLVDGGATDV
jgi:DNA-binding CsgD family transcriptional regulator